MPSADLESFAKLVRERRVVKQFTQSKLGDLVGAGNRTISDVERAVSWPDTPTVLALCRVLDIELPKGLDK